MQRKMRKDAKGMRLYGGKEGRMEATKETTEKRKYKALELCKERKNLNTGWMKENKRIRDKKRRNEHLKE